MNLDSLEKISSSGKRRAALHHCVRCYMGIHYNCISIGYPHSDKKYFGFCCSCPLLPISWMVVRSSRLIFSKQNPLGQLGFLFTMNQLLYLLIVMWSLTPFRIK